MNLDAVLAERSTKTIYRDGDNVIKVFNKAYSKANVLTEALNHARVESDTDLCVPELLGVEMVDGKWAIITRFVEGKTIAELMKENPEKTDEYLDMFVKLQNEVHSKRSPLLGRHKDKMSRKIDEAQLDDNVKYDLHTRLNGMKNHTKLCHGDFVPENVVVKEDGTLCILDWAHATQGNASADVARTYLVFCLKGEEDLAEKYLEKFCAVAGIDRSYVQNWLPIVAASQSVKGNEIEREFLLKWASVVEAM